MEIANIVEPSFIITVDADEFYPLSVQQSLPRFLQRVAAGVYTGIVLHYHNVWHPPSISDQEKFQWEIVGKLWRVIVCKIWKWRPGTCYKSNHNSPEHDGVLLNRKMKRADINNKSLCFVHMGFAGKLETRIAKNRYYVERGEGVSDHRGAYVRSRASFEKWKPGDSLTGDDKLIPYEGPIPEVFLTEGVEK
jgi:hypothetical protein